MKHTIRILLFCTLLGSLHAEAPSAFAIRNARVVTVSGPVHAQGTVVIRDGLIQAAGENVTIPPDAWVIEGEGLTVYPGLIDALSTWGMPSAKDKGSAPGGPNSSSPPPADGPEDRPMTTSWVRAADTLEPSDKDIKAARDAGFTTAVVFPTKGIFAGQGSVVNLAGERAGEMVVCPSAAQYLTLSTSGQRSFPVSLMGTIAYIRQIYLDADTYEEARKVYDGNPSGLRRPEYDRALEGVLANNRALLPATTAVDIRRVQKLAADISREVVLYGGHESYAAIDDLKAAGLPILVSLKWPERDKKVDPEQEDALRVLELREKAPGSPKALAEAGIKWAFYSGEVEKPADAVKAVRRAIDAGLTTEDAIRALTLSPAEIYGVADRLGSIEAGKIANLVLTEGDLFGEKTKVRHVFIDGVKYTPLAAPAPEEKK